MKQKIEKQKCEICGKNAVYRFSPDMDLRGLGSCKKHKVEMTMAYMALIKEGEKAYHDMIDSFKNGRLKL